MVPADQQLDAARQPHLCGFLFADHGMTLQVEALFGGQHAGRTNVFAVHDHFADVVDERRLLQEEPVA